MHDERLNHFNDFRKPYMARGNFMWGQYAVVISPNIPKNHIGDEIRPVWPHPLWRFFVRLFRRPDVPACFVPGAPIEEEQIFEVAGKLFMSPAAWDAIKKRAEINAAA